MKYLIEYKNKQQGCLEFLLSKLPESLRTSLTGYFNSQKFKQIDEIRFKVNSYICLIVENKNIITDIYVSDDMIDNVFNALCNYSIYAHFNTIKDGYISVGNGIRASVCGKAVLENEVLTGIHSISSINIRIPNYIPNASNYLFSLLTKTDFSKSVIVYSSPGVGKTTILRDLIVKIENTLPKIRYAVIDTKEEIISGINQSISGDVYLSYPKGLAIELATRGMTPQYIICDEISSSSEAVAINKALNSGVNLVATTHAGSLDDLMSKEIFKGLLNKGIFHYALGVYRNYGDKHYRFELTELKN